MVSFLATTYILVGTNSNRCVYMNEYCPFFRMYLLFHGQHVGQGGGSYFPDVRSRYALDAHGRRRSAQASHDCMLESRSSHRLGEVHVHPDCQEARLVPAHCIGSQGYDLEVSDTRLRIGSNDLDGSAHQTNTKGISMAKYDEAGPPSFPTSAEA